MCERKKILKLFYKKNHRPYSSFIHPCTSIRMRRTRRPKIGFNNEVEIVYLLFHFIKTPLIFESLITK